MGRRVVTAKDVAAREGVGVEKAETKVEIDDYKTKLAKYIPGEIIAAYVAIDVIIKSATKFSEGVYWIVFLALLVLTPLYVWRVTTEPPKKAAIAQIVVSTIAFFVWVFALGGPFASLGWYVPVYGAILLVIYTAAIPVVVGRS